MNMDKKNLNEEQVVEGVEDVVENSVSEEVQEVESVEEKDNVEEVEVESEVSDRKGVKIKKGNSKFGVLMAVVGVVLIAVIVFVVAFSLGVLN